VLHESPAASANGGTRSVTWGSASADRSITGSEERPGSRSTTLLGGRHARGVSASAGNDCGARFRLLSAVVCAGNSKKATGRSDAVLAAGEGNSSKGVNRVAGKAPWPSAALRGEGRSGGTGNAANPCPVAGCNKPANQRAEQTVEVVRNHEGGTFTAPGSAVTKGACPREWTHAGDVGGRANANLTRGRSCREATPAFAGALRSGDQGHEGGHSSTSVEDGRRNGKPSGAQPATAEGRGGRRKGQTTCYRSGDWS
jgi:hypothetical protein